MIQKIFFSLSIFVILNTANSAILIIGNKLDLQDKIIFSKDKVSISPQKVFSFKQNDITFALKNTFNADEIRLVKTFNGINKLKTDDLIFLTNSSVKFLGNVSTNGAIYVVSNNKVQKVKSRAKSKKKTRTANVTPKTLKPAQMRLSRETVFPSKDNSSDIGPNKYYKANSDRYTSSKEVEVIEVREYVATRAYNDHVNKFYMPTDNRRDRERQSNFDFIPLNVKMHTIKPLPTFQLPTPK